MEDDDKPVRSSAGATPATPAEDLIEPQTETCDDFSAAGFTDFSEDI